VTGNERSEEELVDKNGDWKRPANACQVEDSEVEEGKKREKVRGFRRRC